MKLSTGKVAFPIEFDNGDKAVIYFNPNDRGIQERIQAFENSIETRMRAINVEAYRNRLGNMRGLDVEEPEKLLEMSASELKDLHEKCIVIADIEEEYNKAVRDELDVVFGSKISDVAFRYCQPFDAVIVEDENGNEKREMYIMHFIHWLMVELKRHSAENQSAMEKHISKYSK